jgi:hypothetical protein
MTSSSMMGCRGAPLTSLPPLILLETLRPKGDVLIDAHPVPDDAGFTDDDAGEALGLLRDRAGDERHFQLIEFVSKAEVGERQQPWIAEDDLSR